MTPSHRAPHARFRPFRAALVVTLATGATLAAPLVPPAGGEAAAQITGTGWWWSLVPSPDMLSRLEGGRLEFGDLMRGGFVVASDVEQPSEVVLIAAHLRDAKVVGSGLVQGVRTRGGRSTPRVTGVQAESLRQSARVSGWRFDFPMPSGVVAGGSGGGLPDAGSVRRIDQPVLLQTSLGRGSGRMDLGIYAGGAWIARTLEEGGVTAKIDWNRHEAVYLVAIPADARLREGAKLQALVVPIVPAR